MTRIIFISLLATLAMSSCNNDKEPSTRSEILKLILEERLPLNSTNRILAKSSDTIKIADLTLIENSFNGFIISKEDSMFAIFSYHAPGLRHLFFADSTRSILDKIKNLKFSNWDTAGLNIKINIDRPAKLNPDSAIDKTASWISDNVYKKSFLQISEPIFNSKGQVLVSSLLRTGDYVIDKFYILTQKNGQWSITESKTLVSKYSSPTIETTTDPSGEVITTETRYATVIGYYDL